MTYTVPCAKKIASGRLLYNKRNLAWYSGMREGSGRKAQEGENIDLHVVQSLIVSDSLGPRGLQHAQLPCPLPSPRVCSNSRPSRR